MSLHDALGNMKLIPQFFVWRLEWNASEGKYNKTPCRNDGAPAAISAGDPANWQDYASACDALAALPKTHALTYALGFWLTADCGYWFFDLDKVSAGDGVLNDHAAACVGAFPGALVEWSSSLKGVHVIGRRGGAALQHGNRTSRESGLNYEFYTAGRGIAFGLSGEAQGSADTLHDGMVATLIAQYFPQRAVVEKRSGPAPEWRGPSDDDELIRRMLNASPSAAVAFSGKRGLASLWAGPPTPGQESEEDMALACHLVFWTGGDEDRIVRLMMRSGAKRDKWFEHRTYLRELTVRAAIAQVQTYYQEPIRSTAARDAMYGVPPLPDASTAVVTMAPQKLISDEMAKAVESFLDLITAAGTYVELHNDIIPAIAATNVPMALRDVLAGAINKKLDSLGAKLSIGKVRALISPKVVAGSAGGDMPLWIKPFCWVNEKDCFYDTETGAQLSPLSFQANFTRMMPQKENGGFENPCDWALNRWHIPTVQSVMYRPDEPQYFSYSGWDYANLYNPNSLPDTATSLSAEGIEGIQHFQQMLFDVCGRRQEVFLQLLWWFAHNVKHPGKKIRWAPIIKGTPGDCKSLLFACLRASVGPRNYSTTDISTLANSGGFTDWAARAAVNIIEEVMLTGRERHKIYNAMKTAISNDTLNINAKGKGTYDILNVTNHAATTNANDGLPIDKEDRRWLVIFTPWASLAGMREYCGLTVEGMAERIASIDSLFRNRAPELRAWFLSIEIGSEFNRNGPALLTPEKRRMMASSQDEAEGVTAQIITDGGHGVTSKVISSNCLGNLLRIRAQTDNFEVPKGQAMNHMLTRMGYSRLEKQVKWKGSPHTIWVINGFSDNNDDIRAELDRKV